MKLSFPHTYMFQKLEHIFAPSDLYQKNLTLFQTLGTFPLPDFSDVTLPNGRCSCMTPQGICTTGRYIIITAYCNIKRFRKELEKSKNKKRNITKIPEKQTVSKKLSEQLKTEKTHASCLMVFDKNSHEYLSLLELPDQNHVGGITYDGTYLWIAKSTDNCLSIIRETDLDHVVNMLSKNNHIPAAQKTTLKQKFAPFHTSQTEPDSITPRHEHIPCGKIQYFQNEIPCGITASFVTFYKNRIWVGYCAPTGKKGFLRSFQIQKNPNDKKTPVSLAFDQELEIPAKANGASFYEPKTSLRPHDTMPACTYLFLSISGGRKKASKMLLYNVDGLHLLNSFLLPPLLEESCIDENILYTLYESSSPAYRDVPGNSCPFPIDVVSMAKAEGFFEINAQSFCQ